MRCRRTRKDNEKFLSRLPLDRSSRTRRFIGVWHKDHQPSSVTSPPILSSGPGPLSVPGDPMIKWLLGYLYLSEGSVRRNPFPSHGIWKMTHCPDFFRGDVWIPKWWTSLSSTECYVKYQRVLRNVLTKDIRRKMSLFYTLQNSNFFFFTDLIWFLVCIVFWSYRIRGLEVLFYFRNGKCQTSPFS